MKKWGKMKSIENLLLAIFVMVLVASIIFGVVLNMPQISLALLLVDFPIAAVTAVYASLSIREEEEEKSS